MRNCVLIHPLHLELETADLKVWEKAHRLTLAVYKATSLSHNMKCLVSQASLGVLQFRSQRTLPKVAAEMDHLS